MSYKNTYKFLQNVLAAEDASLAHSKKMKGGSCKTSKYVRREEYEEVLKELDSLRCQFEVLQKRMNKGSSRKNMTGGDESGKEYEDKSVMPEAAEAAVDNDTKEPEMVELNISDVVTDKVDTSSNAEKTNANDETEHVSKFDVAVEENDTKETKEESEDEEESSSSSSDEEYMPTLEGGADADEIFKELGGFNSAYFNAGKGKPALKGGFEVSSNKFNWYPY